jgi:hypothetical protein
LHDISGYCQGQDLCYEGGRLDSVLALQMYADAPAAPRSRSEAAVRVSHT